MRSHQLNQENGLTLLIEEGDVWLDDEVYPLCVEVYPTAPFNLPVLVLVKLNFVAYRGRGNGPSRT